MASKPKFKLVMWSAHWCLLFHLSPGSNGWECARRALSYFCADRGCIDMYVFFC